MDESWAHRLARRWQNSTALPAAAVATADLGNRGWQANSADKPADGPEPGAFEPTDEAAGEPRSRDEQCADFARNVEQVVAADDREAAHKLVDWDQLTERIFSGIKATKQEKEAYRNSLDQSDFLASICQAVANGGTFRFLRIKPDGHKRRAVFRLRPQGGGVNYYELLLAENAGGKLLVNDVEIYLNGKRYSDSMHFAVLIDNCPNLPAWQAGLSDQDMALVRNANTVGAMRQDLEAEQFQSVLADYDRLPADVQHTLPLLLRRMRAATEIGAAEAAAAFDDLMRFFPGNPAVDLISIDYYSLSNRFEESRKAVQRLDRRVGGDPYLQILLASSFLGEGNLPEAAKCADVAIEQEPTMATAYWTRITVALGAKDYAKVVEMLNLLESKLNIRIGDMASAPLYADFVQSDEFRQWQADHRQPADDMPADDQPADDQPANEDMPADDDD